MTIDDSDARLWEQKIEEGIRSFLRVIGSSEDPHVQDTPQRFIKSLKEYFSGVHITPQSILRTDFDHENYNEMILVKNIQFVSFCAHHLIPFMGKVHFGYIPDKRIVGLSKIPGLVEALSHRPQVQERLTQQIADNFNYIVKPKGCGVVIEATHMCMAIRGVKKENALTVTTVLIGGFQLGTTKAEFLSQIKG